MRKKGIRHVYGMLNIADSIKYEGSWNYSRINGFGILTYSDGSTFTGFFENNMRVGKGNQTIFCNII